MEAINCQQSPSLAMVPYECRGRSEDQLVAR
jgi:hypothetical protein